MRVARGRLTQLLALAIVTLTVLTIVVIAVSRSGHAITSVSAGNPQHPGQAASRSNLSSDREALSQLYSQLKNRAAFTPEESGILLKFANGEAISDIEADVVISRALYARDVSGKGATPEQKELLGRYEQFVGTSRTSGPATTTACVPCTGYTVTQSTGVSIVPGTTDTTNHCDDCTTPITLPFAYSLYDQTFTTARVSSNGNLQFGSSNSNLGGCIPQGGIGYTIFAYYSDLYTADTVSGQGVFTSVSGTAPNRIFNVEWRTRFCCAGGVPTQNFEIRLYEGQQKFEVVYGQIDNTGSSVSVGVQKDGNCSTQFECGIANSLSSGLRLTFNATPAPPAPTTYTFSQSTGASIVPGTTDTGNHCDDCTTPITLPFAYTLYDQTFTTARVSSNGNLQFAGSNASLGGCLPQFGFSYSIFAFYEDLLTCCNAPPNGVFTSVSGTAPNRIFNVEWRTRFCCSSGPSTQNFEIRLYEGQLRFDIIYGQLDNNGSFVAVGVQRDPGCFTQYECNTANTLSPGLQLTFSTGPCTALTCPADVTVAAPQCPLTGGSIVNFPAPVPTGDCGAITCVPAPGSFFPVGTTTVTCTSVGGASCSFRVTVQLCLQDETVASNSVFFNPATGQYRFCCSGMNVAGTGTVTVRGCIVTIEHNSLDRRVLITFDGSVKKGTAVLLSLTAGTKCAITDRDTSNNTCQCSPPPSTQLSSGRASLPF